MVQYDNFPIVFKTLKVAQESKKICTWALILKDCFQGSLIMIEEKHFVANSVL